MKRVGVTSNAQPTTVGTRVKAYEPIGARRVRKTYFRASRKRRFGRATVSIRGLVRGGSPPPFGTLG